MQYAGSVQLDSPLPPQVQGQVADQIKRARDVMVAEATDAPAAAAAPPPVAAAAPPPAPAAAPAPPPRRRARRAGGPGEDRGPPRQPRVEPRAGPRDARRGRRRRARRRDRSRLFAICGGHRGAGLRRRVPRVAQPRGARRDLRGHWRHGAAAAAPRGLRARAREVESSLPGRRSLDIYNASSSAPAR